MTTDEQKNDGGGSEADGPRRSSRSRPAGHPGIPAYLRDLFRGDLALDPTSSLPAGWKPPSPRVLNTLLLLQQVTAAHRTRAEPTEIGMPQRINRFLIVGKVGSGAQATVYEARDPKLRRTVALKVASTIVCGSPELRARFKREAQLACRVCHPHVAPIFEVDHDGEPPSIVQEFCAGGNLADWLDRHPGPLPARQAAELMRALTLGVAAVHARGVLNRDIKPSNVLLAEDLQAPILEDAEGKPRYTVKLSDFGLGTLMAGHGSWSGVGSTTGSEPLSGAPLPLGTERWMAPEQWEGQHDHRTDVHALGLILERLLDHAGSSPSLADAEPASPPKGARPNAGDPSELRVIARKARMNKPLDRYQSADELTAALDRFLDGKGGGGWWKWWSMSTDLPPR